MVTVSIQAGGQSSRMGQDKALVELAGKPMIEHVLQKVEGLGDEILITTNNPDQLEYLQLPLYPDPHPGQGALHGLQTALEAAKHETILILACDMPFANPALLDYLLHRSPEADLVIPRRQGYYEPLHAVYGKACLPAITQALEAGQERMISFFPAIEVLTIDEPELDRFDPEGLSFFNVNTPEELERAERLLAARGQ